MMNLSFKKMTIGHIDSVSKLEKQCFSTPWSKEALTTELTNGFARFFVALKDNVVVGYIGCHNVLGEVYITNVAVSPDYRKQGVGEFLVRNLVETMKNEKADFVTLEVRKSNFAAISLYEKCSFKVVGERKNFYEKPCEDAVLMTVILN